MGFWYYFWTINFIVSGSAFAFIAVIVTVRGSQDLRSMFARLKESSAARELENAPPNRNGHLGRKQYVCLSCPALRHRLRA